MKKTGITDLLLFILGAELVGVLSALVSGGRFGEVYGALSKPPLSPPGIVFPVVWSVLYALMGISAYMICSSGKEGRGKALRLYTAQLLVNFLWSPVFFGLGQSKAAAVVITVLIALVIVMAVRFLKLSRCAAALNIPYLLWLLYAAYLNYGAVVLNG